MTAHKTSWHCLPAEIRISILEALLQDSCQVSLASLATVSREWQTVIERHNFARIKLTLSRLTDFSLIICRNRALVRYIWLCLELQEYNCTKCAPEDEDMWGLSNMENMLITTALRNLFLTLSGWEPNSNLLLDISVYSPSDSKHWFKYLTFEPDIPSHECDQNQYAEQSILAEANDHNHCWNLGSQDFARTEYAITKVFEEIIIGEGLFDEDNEQEENQWWQQLPLVPAITGVLLRQQNRRRWQPTTLARMFARLPRLQEIYYEPWREWNKTEQNWADQCKYYHWV
jgi:hypothetical protein